MYSAVRPPYPAGDSSRKELSTNRSAAAAAVSASSTLGDGRPAAASKQQSRKMKSNARGAGCVTVTPPPTAGGEPHLARPPHSALMGRLTDGTMHRSSVVGATVDAGNVSVAAEVAAVVQAAASRGTWAAQFDDAMEMRAAVTTDKDAQTDFEFALVEEVNLLRRDPKAYAALFEREATLGYPFVCGDDEYFTSDAAADTVHAYRPDVLDALGPRRPSLLSDHCGASTAQLPPGSATGSTQNSGRRPVSADSESAAGASEDRHLASDATTKAGGSTSHRRSRSRSTTSTNANGGNSGSNTNTNSNAAGNLAKRANGGNAPSSTAGASAGAHTDVLSPISLDKDLESHQVNPQGDGKPPASPILFRTTLQSYGMSELNLADLRVHFRRHQRHRTALEAALKSIAQSWQRAQQAQQDAWAAEDEKSAKKAKRGNGGATGRKRSAVGGGAASLEEVFAARKAVMETLNSTFAEQLRGVYSELEHEREACRRAMAGANVLLDCVRALREAPPAPPLRSSRGLTLAAREASTTFHASEDRVSALIGTQRILATHGAYKKQLPPPPAPLSILGVGDDSCQGCPVFTGEVRADDADEAVRTHTLLEVMLHELDGTPATAATSMGASGTNGCEVPAAAVDVLTALGLPPSRLRSGVEALTEATRASCGNYGYVSGEVRGLQLYGAGSPRALVMRALLGVAEPVFSFTENARNGHSGGAAGGAKADARMAPAQLPKGAGKGERGPRERSIDARLYDTSVFNPNNGLVTDDVVVGAGEGWSSASGTTTQPATSAFYNKGLTAAAAIQLCGELHVTTPHAAHHFTSHEVSQSTTAGRRAAQAVRRLGPLMWQDAHLIGCGWQQVRPQRSVPTYDQALLQIQADSDGAVDGGIPADHPLLMREPDAPLRGGLVGTTLVVASGYEELDVVRRKGGSFGLAEIRRVVHEQLGTSRSDVEAAMTPTEIALNERYPYRPVETVGAQVPGAGSASFGSGTQSGRGKGNLLAVVDLHSALGVELLAPLTHPIRLRSQCATTTGGSDCRVVVIAAKADARRVQLQACVTAATGTTIPRAPTVEPELVLVQRSPDDVDVTLILVDVEAVMAKLANTAAPAGASPSRVEALVHVYELSKQAAPAQWPSVAQVATVGDGPTRTPSPSPSTVADPHAAANVPAGSLSGGGEVSGYEPIGFIRLILEPDTRPAAAAATTLGGSLALTGSAVRAVPQLRSSAVVTTASSDELSDSAAASAAAQPYLRSLDLASRGVATSRAQRSLLSTPAGVPRPVVPSVHGWPVVSQDFADRCASILAPLSSYLVAGDEDGANALVRVAVRIPPRAASSYLERHVAAVRAQLTILQLAQQIDDEGEDKAAAGATPPGPTEAAESQQEPPRESCALSPPPSPVPQQPDQPAAQEGTHGGLTKPHPRQQPTPKPPAGGGNKTQARKTATSTAAASTKKQQRPSKGSSPPATTSLLPPGTVADDSLSGAVAPEVQLMLYTPTDALRSKRFFDLEYLAKTGLQTLQTAVEALAAASAECQGRLERGRQVLDGELERIRVESERRKGRELLRLRHEENDIVAQLREAERTAGELATCAAAAKDIFLRRTRDRALRVARMEQLSSELESLTRETASAEGESHTQQQSGSEYRVLLWLCAPSSSGSRVKGPSSLSALPAKPLVTAASCGSGRGGDKVTHEYTTEHGYCVTLSTSTQKCEASGTAECREAALGDGVYEALFRIPAQFKGGRAVLLVDDIENAMWHIL